jgi:thioredoxin-related protein
MNVVSLAARTLFACMLLAPSLFVQAQKTVQYEQLTFEEAMAKAKKEKKIIFTDVQHSTSGPANEQVVREVFPVDSVARFFKDHVIAIKIDMHSEEGKKFAPRLAMLMYPAYIFYTNTGDQLSFTNAGSVSKDPASLMVKARESWAVAREKEANKRSIVFTKGTWDALLEKARKEKKMIFLDAHTTWCRPCIMMARDVFTLNNVADFYNKNFINAEMDMEKGEGPALAKKYEIHAYPTFLFIDGNGNLISSEGGYKEAPLFIAVGQAALDKKVKGSTASASATVVPMMLMQPGGGGSQTMAPAQPVAKKEKPSAILFADSNWTAMLAEAKKDGKLIFVDAYTTWCGPCKQMRASVFTQEKVGQLYNRNFVNAYIDMEKGEGIELRKKYNVRFYPTYLFVNGDGELVHRVVGSCSAEEFMQHGLDAASPSRNLAALEKAYAEKRQDIDLVRSYLAALGNANDDEMANKVASDYLQGINPNTWSERANYALIKEYVKDVTSPMFAYLVKNQQKFGDLYGEKEVDEKIYATYLAWPLHYVAFPKDAPPVFNEAGFNEFIGSVKATGYSRKADVVAKSYVTVSMSLRKWDLYTKTVNDMLKAKLVPQTVNGADQLFMYATNVNRFASQENKAAFEAAIKWTEVILQDYKDISTLRKAETMDLYAELLDKTGDVTKAAAVRKQIDQEGLTKAKRANPMQALIVPHQ